MFPDRHRIKEPWIIRNIADVLFGCDRRLDNIMAGKHKISRGRGDNPAQGAQGRCLARPIWPEQPEDLAGFN